MSNFNNNSTMVGNAHQMSQIVTDTAPVVPMGLGTIPYPSNELSDHRMVQETFYPADGKTSPIPMASYNVTNPAWVKHLHNGPNGQRFSSDLLFTSLDEKQQTFRIQEIGNMVCTMVDNGVLFALQEVPKQLRDFLVTKFGMDRVHIDCDRPDKSNCNVVCVPSRYNVSEGQTVSATNQNFSAATGVRLTDRETGFSFHAVSIHIRYNKTDEYATNSLKYYEKVKEPIFLLGDFNTVCRKYPEEFETKATAAAAAATLATAAAKVAKEMSEAAKNAGVSWANLAIANATVAATVADAAAPSSYRPHRVTDFFSDKKFHFVLPRSNEPSWTHVTTFGNAGCTSRMHDAFDYIGLVGEWDHISSLFNLTH